MARLVIVFNRVPAPGQRSPAAGGLAVALHNAAHQRDCLWFGWSGPVSARRATAAPQTAWSREKSTSPQRTGLVRNLHPGPENPASRAWRETEQKMHRPYFCCNSKNTWSLSRSPGSGDTAEFLSLMSDPPCFK
jgi:hypothetical protein